MIFLILIFILIAIIFAIKTISSNWNNTKFSDVKGEWGEKAVASVLGDTIEKEQYVINDILFKTCADKSCQIDHIYINRNGIFVIETKNYSGMIYGQEDQREWVQVLSYGEVKNKLYNPIKQNDTHIYHLSKYLGVKNVFFNVVVFLNNADISNVKATNVYNIFNLNYIKTLQTGVRLSEFQMESYYKKLLYLKERDGLSEKEHIQNIRKMQVNLQNGICPRCNGNLVLRKGKSGEFYGCSNYPKCKFSKNIEE